MEEGPIFTIENRLTEPHLYFTNLLINIEMLPCPLGFEYHNTSMMCTCDSKLVEYKVLMHKLFGGRVHFGSLQQKKVKKS